MLLFNQLSRLLLALLFLAVTWSICIDFSVGVLFHLGSLNRLLVLVRLELFSWSDVIKNPASTKVLDCALGVNTAVKHANEVVRSRNDEFDMVGYQDLDDDAQREA